MATKKTTTPDDDAEDSRGINWMAILLILMCCTIFVTGCTGTLAFVGYKIYDRVVDTDAEPKPVPSDRLAKSIEDVGVSVPHAVYFSKVCDGVAHRLEADAETKTPIFDQRKEAFDLVGNVGSLAVAGNDAANYKRLPDVIVQAFDDVWESDRDGRFKAGPLTEMDRKQVIIRWQKLADAFREVSE
jgi:hypothetical protein